jgi:hypothetical protein
MGFSACSWHVSGQLVAYLLVPPRRFTGGRNEQIPRPPRYSNWTSELEWPIHTGLRLRTSNLVDLPSSELGYPISGIQKPAVMVRVNLPPGLPYSVHSCFAGLLPTLSKVSLSREAIFFLLSYLADLTILFLV